MCTCLIQHDSVIEASILPRPEGVSDIYISSYLRMDSPRAAILLVTCYY